MSAAVWTLPHCAALKQFITSSVPRPRSLNATPPRRRTATSYDESTFNDSTSARAQRDRAGGPGAWRDVRAPAVVAV
eukprot:123609-Chlamydomonas_euryale.AAC.2